MLFVKRKDKLFKTKHMKTISLFAVLLLSIPALGQSFTGYAMQIVDFRKSGEVKSITGTSVGVTPIILTETHLEIRCKTPQVIRLVVKISDLSYPAWLGEDSEGYPVVVSVVGTEFGDYAFRIQYPGRVGVVFISEFNGDHIPR